MAFIDPFDTGVTDILTEAPPTELVDGAAAFVDPFTEEADNEPFIDPFDEPAEDPADAEEPQPTVAPTPEDERVVQLSLKQQETIEKQRSNIESAKKGGWLSDVLPQFKSKIGTIRASTAFGRAVLGRHKEGGEEKLKSSLAFYDKMHELDAATSEFVDGPFGGDVFEGAVGFIAQMGAQYASAWDEALIGAGLGLVVGRPIVGAIAGLNVGNARAWYEQGVGDFYREFSKAGIEDSTATMAAVAGAVPYAATEFLSGYLPGLKGLSSFKVVARASLAKTALSAAKAWVGRSVAEASEESIQQFIQDTFQNWAGNLSNEFQGTEVEKLASSDMFQRGLSAFTQSILPIMLSGAVIGGQNGHLSIATETAAALKESKRLRQSQQGDQASSDIKDAPTAGSVNLSQEGLDFINEGNTEEHENVRDAALAADVDAANQEGLSKESRKAFQWLHDKQDTGEPLTVALSEVDVDENRKAEAASVRAFFEHFTGAPVLFIDGGDKVPNGMATANAMYVNVTSSQAPLLQVAAHETGHNISHWAKVNNKTEHIDTINEAVNLFKGKTEYWNKFAAVLENKGIGSEALTEETTAMIFAEIISNEAAMKELAATDQNLFQKVWALIQDFFASISDTAKKALGIRDSLDFRNPKTGPVTGTQNLNTMSRESLEAVFGDEYKRITKGLLAAAKDYTASTPSSILTELIETEAAETTVAEAPVKAEAKAKPTAEAEEDNILISEEGIVIPRKKSAEEKAITADLKDQAEETKENLADVLEESPLDIRRKATAARKLASAKARSKSRSVKKKTTVAKNVSVLETLNATDEQKAKNEAAYQARIKARKSTQKSRKKAKAKKEAEAKAESDAKLIAEEQAAASISSIVPQSKEAIDASNKVFEARQAKNKVLLEGEANGTLTKKQKLELQRERQFQKNSADFVRARGGPPATIKQKPASSAKDRNKARVTLQSTVKALNGTVKKSEDFASDGEWVVTIGDKTVRMSSHFNPEASKWWYNDTNSDNIDSWKPAGEFIDEAVNAVFNAKKQKSTEPQTPLLSSKGEKIELDASYTRTLSPSERKSMKGRVKKALADVRGTHAERFDEIPDPVLIAMDEAMVNFDVIKGNRRDLMMWAEKHGLIKEWRSKRKKAKDALEVSQAGARKAEIEDRREDKKQRTVERNEGKRNEAAADKQKVKDERIAAAEQQFNKGGVIRISTGRGFKKKVRVFTYTSEDADFYYGQGKRKFAKSEFTETEDISGQVIFHATGRRKSYFVEQIPVSRLSTSGKVMIFTPSETTGKWEKGQTYRKRINGNVSSWWVDKPAKASPITDSDKLWAQTTYGNEGYLVNRAKNYLPFKEGEKNVSSKISIANIQHLIANLMTRISTQDIVMLEGVKPKGKALRMQELSDSLIKLQKSDNPRAMPMTLKGEDQMKLSENSLAFRLAFMEGMKTHIRTFINAERTDGKKVSIDRSISGEASTFHDIIAAEETKRESGLGEANVEKVTEAVKAATGRSLTKQETAMISGLRDAVFEEDGNVDAMDSREGVLEFIDSSRTLSGISADRKTSIIGIVNTLFNKLEEAKVVQQPRLSTRAEQADASARRQGFAGGYKEVAGLGIRRAVKEYDKISKRRITLTNADHFISVANALYDYLQNPSSTYSARASQALAEINRRYDIYKNRTSGATSRHRATHETINGKVTLVGSERFRGEAASNSLDLGSDLDVALGAEFKTESRSSRASRGQKEVMSRGQADVAQIRAKSLERSVLRVVTKRFNERFGANAGTNKKINDAIEDLWNDVGRPSSMINDVTDADGNHTFELDNRAYKAALARGVDTRLATTSDKAVEWWKSAGLLSGIATIIQNPVSNYARFAYEYGPKKLISDVLSGTNPATALASMGLTMKMHGTFAKRAMKIAKEAFDIEASIITHNGYGQKLDKDSSFHSFKGKSGEIIRIPYRFLNAGDEFAKMVDLQTNLANQYYIAARGGVDLMNPETGVKPFNPSESQIMEFVDSVITDSSNPLHVEAFEAALEHTWQNRNKYGEPIARARSAIPHGLGNFVLPFINTPMNIFTQSLRMSPLGIVNMGNKAIKNAMERSNNPDAGKYIDFKNKEFASDVAEQIIAWGLVMAIKSLVTKPDDDDEDWLPLMTGSRPAFKFARGKGAFQRKQAMPPMHFRIGDKMIDYSRIEPFATILPIILDGLETKGKIEAGEKPGKAIAEIWATTGVAMSDKTFLSGMNDIIRAIEEPDSLSRWASGFAASWVPNIVRSTVRSFDPYARDLTPKGETYSKDWLVSMGRKTGFRALPHPQLNKLIKTPSPQFDYWGQKVKRVGEAGPSSDIGYKIASLLGLKIKIAPNQKLNMMLKNWNDRERFVTNSRDPETASARYFFKPAKSFTIKKGKRGQEQKYYMTDDEYQAYIRDSGKMALARASRMSFNYEHPAYRDIKKLMNVMEISRRIVRNRLKSKVRKRK